ncbi:MAG TPA: allantoinase AllB [Streptosporangiaceae bacterium]|nr:allantoinase AllB [Streptosporangiaceae bacterium]
MTPGFDLVIRAPRAVVGGAERPATVGVRDGVIAAVAPLDVTVAAAKVIELTAGEVLLPGLVDTHVHVCEPGHADWEGFATATAAAAAGGVTTLVDMPLDSVPSTTTVAALELKRQAAAGQCHVDVGFWGGVVPGNERDRAPLHDAGVLGFKCFLADSGADDFPPVSHEELEDALGALRPLGSPLLVHAESAEAAGPSRATRVYAEHLAARPRAIENVAVGHVIGAVRRSGGRAHIVHLSSSDALPAIAAARRDGIAVTAETCPHYLVLASEEIADGATQAKASPPVREAANRELLWAGLRDGTIDLVASDHSPATPAMKELDTGDFSAAWGGVCSLQLALPLTWTAARQRGIPLADVATWMSTRPARLAGLDGKGRIAPGCDADFCVLAPDEPFDVDHAVLRHRHALTPYAGRALKGVVRASLLRGEPAGAGRPHGALLSRAPR